MPVEGVSNVRRLPRLGFIRLGIKKMSQGGKEYPSEVDYFILDPKTGNPSWDAELKAQFAKLYGEKPTCIKICFPPAPREMVFPQWRKAYTQGALLVCKGDGVEAAASTEEWAKRLPALDPPRDERGMFRVQCAGEECPYAAERKCRITATLQVMLPEVRGTGCWQINTSSFHNIVTLNSAFDWLEGLCGRSAMIPVNLMRVPEAIAFEGKRTTHYLLKVDQQSVSLMDLQKAALIPVTRFALPPPDETRDELLDPPGGHEPKALPAPVVPVEAGGIIETPPSQTPKANGNGGQLKGIKLSNEMKPLVDSILKHRQRVGEEAFSRAMGDAGIGSMEQFYTSRPEAIRLLNTLSKVKNIVGPRPRGEA